ncbi:phage tail tape measure protein [Acinetobacter baumannii]|uniref:phage tail tape measure protein n=1 Tax=Acinetobacter baumannii TaxID=470 RepID=UPI003879E785
MSNKKLSAIITIGGEVAGSLRTAIGSTTTQLGKIGSEIKRVKKNQAMLGESIRTFGSMGKNVDNLRARYSGVTDELNRLTRAQEKLTKVEASRVKNQQKLHELTSQIGSTVATAISLGAPVVMAAKFETAMLGIAKQLDGARDESGKLTKDFFNMQKEVQLLGRTLPIATNEIASMVAESLKMGVGKKDVIEFTKVVAEMGTAFELPVDQLAQDMGKIANMYKIPIKNIDDLADTINYLDDNAIASGKDIIDFMQRVGGTASMVKITDKNTAALGSTLLTLGEKAETSATAINAVFSKLGAANTQSKPFRAMVEELGLTTGQLGRGMQTDAIGTIFEVMDKIKQLPKVAKDGQTSQIDAVATLFGAEHWDTFSKLMENRAELEKQLRLSTSSDASGSMSREFKARMETTEAQWQTFKNRGSELAVNIGSVLLPAVNSIMSSVGNVVSVFADWSQQHPKLTKVIVSTVVALGALKVGMLVARLAIFAIKSPILSIIGGFTRLSASGGIVGKAFRAMLNPIGLFKSAFGMIVPIVKQVGFILLRTPWGIAAAAAVAAGVLIYKYWDRIKAFFSGFWTGLKQGIAPVVASFTDLYKSMSWLEPVIQMIGRGIGIVYDWFMKLISPAKATEEQLKTATSAGESFGRVVGTAIEWILKPITTLVDALSWIHKNIGGIIGKVADLANKAPTIGGFFGAVKSSLGFGGGSKNAPTSQPRASVPYRTGPAPQIRGASGTKPSVTQHFNQPITVHAAPGQNPNEIANLVTQKMNRANGVAQRGSMLAAGYAQ